jgi:hypothetical protein
MIRPAFALFCPLSSVPRSLFLCLLVLTSFIAATCGPTLAQECRLAPRSRAYNFASDSLVWTFTIAAGSSCVRGIRYNDTIISNVEILDPPSTGKLTVNMNSFLYTAGPIAGVDAFAFQISGTRLGIQGSSTIRVKVLIE